MCTPFTTSQNRNTTEPPHITYLYRLSVQPCKTEVGQLQLSFVVQQQIREFQISVDDVAVVEVRHRFQELKHEAFYLRLGERVLHHIEQAAEIMLQVFKHKENTIRLVTNNNFLQLHNVGM